MSEISTHASTALTDGDLGDWIGLEIEEAPDASRKVVLGIDQWPYQRAIMSDRGYFSAIVQASPGVAAWWVYSTDEIIATSISSETDYAARLAAARAEVIRRNIQRAQQNAGYIYPAPITYSDMAPAVSLAAGVTGQDVQPEIGPLDDYEIKNESIKINNTARVATKYRPTESAGVVYLSNIISASTRQPLTLTQTSPGIFELPEPGYGALIVSYATKRRMVSIEYEAFSGGNDGFWTDSVKEQFARDVITGGSYKSAEAPPVMILVTSTRTNGQAFASAQRQVGDVGSQMAAGQQMATAVAAIEDEANPAGTTLTEQSRSIVTKRIYAAGSQTQYVEVAVATEIAMRDGQGRGWTFRFNES